MGAGWALVGTNEPGPSYERAAIAAASGDWSSAFMGFHRVAQVNPDFRDVSDRLVVAAENLLNEETADLSIEVEVVLVRWLANRGDHEALRIALDRSMVTVPAGWGTMGSDTWHPNEQPGRSVYLDEYTIDRYEVTNLQYALYVDQTGEPPPVYWSEGTFPNGQSSHPVLGVSWRQASEYCRWAGKRLPTEAEWERACRGPTGLRYPWGDTWDPRLVNVTVSPIADPDDAWLLLARGVPVGGAFPQPVGSHPDAASPYGVLNLCGNAAEWVADWYDPAAYAQLPAENPLGQRPPWNHSIRGSAWLVIHDIEGYVEDVSRCGYRNASHSYDNPRVGFRCAGSP
jgi:formylglycine-generating enzyme required for sulfatase activity